MGEWVFGLQHLQTLTIWSPCNYTISCLIPHYGQIRWCTLYLYIYIYAFSAHSAYMYIQVTHACKHICLPTCLPTSVQASSNRYILWHDVILYFPCAFVTDFFYMDGWIDVNVPLGGVSSSLFNLVMVGSWEVSGRFRRCLLLSFI